MKNPTHLKKKQV